MKIFSNDRQFDSNIVDTESNILSPIALLIVFQKLILTLLLGWLVLNHNLEDRNQDHDREENDDDYDWGDNADESRAIPW